MRSFARFIWICVCVCVCVRMWMLSGISKNDFPKQFSAPKLQATIQNKTLCGFHFANEITTDRRNAFATVIWQTPLFHYRLGLKAVFTGYWLVKLSRWSTVASVSASHLSPGCWSYLDFFLLHLHCCWEGSRYLCIAEKIKNPVYLLSLLPFVGIVRLYLGNDQLNR